MKWIQIKQQRFCMKVIKVICGSLVSAIFVSVDTATSVLHCSVASAAAFNSSFLSFWMLWVPVHSAFPLFSAAFVMWSSSCLSVSVVSNVSFPDTFAVGLVHFLHALHFQKVAAFGHGGFAIVSPLLLSHFLSFVPMQLSLCWSSMIIIIFNQGYWLNWVRMCCLPHNGFWQHSDRKTQNSPHYNTDFGTPERNVGFL